VALKELVLIVWFTFCNLHSRLDCNCGMWNRSGE